MRRPTPRAPRVRLLLALPLLAAAGAALAQGAPERLPEEGRATTRIRDGADEVVVTWGATRTLPNQSAFEQPFPRLDLDGDERITREELPEGHPLLGEFRLADRNRDGHVDPAEYEAWRGPVGSR